jgi:hypothetical protein
MSNDFNLPLLRKAVEWAESEARKPETESEWDQKHFGIAGEEVGRTCGTAYCIAGWVSFQEGGHVIGASDIDGDGDARVAQDLLGITHEDAWGSGWPQNDAGLFEANNTIERVRAIAERIALAHGEEL